jgi:hypothetical protein
MHRTSLSDLREADTLLMRERPDDLQRSLDLIQSHRSVLALLLVGGMRPSVTHVNGDALEGPLLPVGVHPQGHRGARAERGEHEIVRRRAFVGATSLERFIGQKRVRSCLDLDAKARSADVRADCAFVSLSSRFVCGQRTLQATPSRGGARNMPRVSPSHDATGPALNFSAGPVGSLHHPALPVDYSNRARGLETTRIAL